MGQNDVTDHGTYKMTFWQTLPTHRLLADYSLWSADLANLATSIAHVEPYADLYHLDVADAHFVPGLLFFPDLVAALRPLTRKPFHVHLMTDQPQQLVDDFAAAGADLLTIHAENRDVAATLARIKAAGKRAGLAVQLDTPLAAIESHLPQLDLVVMMGTRLGIKGVGLDERACARITEAKALIAHHGLATQIKVSADGGIREQTVPLLRRAGADLITPGSLVFKSHNLEQTTSWLHRL